MPVNWLYVSFRVEVKKMTAPCRRIHKHDNHTYIEPGPVLVCKPLVLLAPFSEKQYTHFYKDVNSMCIFLHFILGVLASSWIQESRHEYCLVFQSCPENSMIYSDSSTSRTDHNTKATICIATTNSKYQS